MGNDNNRYELLGVPKIMTKLENYLKEVEERCDKATEGPWYSFAGVLKNKEGLKGITKENDDSDFISHARTDLEVLPKIVREQQKIILEQANKLNDSINIDSLIELADQLDKEYRSFIGSVSFGVIDSLIPNQEEG